MDEIIFMNKLYLQTLKEAELEILIKTIFNNLKQIKIEKKEETK